MKAAAATMLECIIDSQRQHIANNLTRASLFQGIIDYLRITVTKSH